MNKANGRLLEKSWAIFSSERTSAILVLLLSLSAFVAVLVPQGRDALDLAKDPTATRLHDLAAWGLTDVFESSWILALGALLTGNLLALAVSVLLRPSARVTAEAPPGAPFRESLKAPFPERAVETVRQALLSRLGAPALESARGSRATLVFDAGIQSKVAPLVTHLGLILLVLGAGLYASEAHRLPRLARAVLEITDSGTMTSGVFDMVENEPFQFFQFRATYTLRAYRPSHQGMGPAVLMERVMPGERGGSSFWVYLNAPEGFDARHRHGEVGIKALRVGYSPVPGSGLANSVFGSLMLFGLALIVAGAFAGRSSRGRLWVDADGDEVVLTALPQSEGDLDFARRFERWVLAARQAMEAEA